MIYSRDTGRGVTDKLKLKDKVIGILRKINRKHMIICSVTAAAIIAAIVLCVYFASQMNNGSEGDMVIDFSPSVTVSAPSDTDEAETTASPTPQATRPVITPTPVPDGAKLIMTGLSYENGNEFKYEYKDGKAILRDELNSIVYYVQYDSAGLKTHEYKNSVLYEFDTEGRIVKHSEYVHGLENGTDTKPYEVYSYEYSEDGLLQTITEIENTNYDGPTRKIYFEYDSNGVCIRKLDTDSYTTSEETYDKSGNIIKRIEYKTYGGELKSQYDYIYDNGILLRIDSVTSPASAGGYVNGYKLYDKAGNEIEEYTQYNGSPGEFVYSYSINEYGDKMFADMSRIFSNGYRSHIYTAKGAVQQLIPADALKDILYDSDGYPVIGYAYGFNDKTGENTFIDPFSFSESNIGGSYSEREYDASGNEISLTFYDENFIPRYSKKTEYDTYGRKMYETHYENSIFGGNHLVFTCSYEYDENGDISKVSTVSWNSDNQRAEYYFKSGLLYQCIINSDVKITFDYTDSGKLDAKTVSYQYSTAVISLSVKYTDLNSNYIDSISVNDRTYDFDASGHLIKEIESGFDSAVKTRYTYEYDSMDRLIRTVAVNENGITVYESDIEYNDSGDAHGDSHVMSRTVITYDESGTVLSNKEYIYMTDNYGAVYENGTITELYGTDSSGRVFSAVFEWIVPDDSDIDYSVYLLSDPTDLIP